MLQKCVWISFAVFLVNGSSIMVRHEIAAGPKSNILQFINVCRMIWTQGFGISLSSKKSLSATYQHQFALMRDVEELNEIVAVKVQGVRDRLCEPWKTGSKDLIAPDDWYRDEFLHEQQHPIAHCGTITSKRLKPESSKVMALGDYKISGLITFLIEY